MASPPTEAEQDILVKFRSKLADLELSRECFKDMHLIRWLRARNMDISKAELMLRKNLEWRDVNDIDTILCGALSPLRTEFPLYLYGFDKDGGPVVVCNYGKWDIRSAVVGRGLKIELTQLILSYFEEVFEVLKQKSENGKVFKQFTIIGDVEGLSLRQFTSYEIVEVILTCVRAFEANFPETLNVCYVVNAPSIFSILYGIAKPFLSDHTARKIQIFSPNNKKLTPAILEHISIENFPKKYGGNKTVPWRQIRGDNCNEPPSDEEEDLLTQTLVNSGDTVEVSCDIDVSNTTLSWVFQTVHYDIGFCVKFCENNEKREVYRYRRVNSHVEKQFGSVLCENKGRYILSFDNTYSRVRSKILHYAVKRDLPTEISSNIDEKFQEL